MCVQWRTMFSLRNTGRRVSTSTLKLDTQVLYATFPLGRLCVDLPTVLSGHLAHLLLLQASSFHSAPVLSCCHHCKLSSLVHDDTHIMSLPRFPQAACSFSFSVSAHTSQAGKKPQRGMGDMGLPIQQLWGLSFL